MFYLKKFVLFDLLHDIYIQISLIKKKNKLIKTINFLKYLYKVGKDREKFVKSFLCIFCFLFYIKYKQILQTQRISEGQLNDFLLHADLSRISELDIEPQIVDTNHASMLPDAELIEVQHGGQTVAKVLLIATNQSVPCSDLDCASRRGNDAVQMNPGKPTSVVTLFCSDRRECDGYQSNETVNCSVSITRSSNLERAQTRSCKT